VEHRQKINRKIKETAERQACGGMMTTAGYCSRIEKQRRRDMLGRRKHRQLRTGFHKHHHEFYRYHKILRVFHPMAFLFSLLVVYLLFAWVGNKTIAIIFALFISIKELLQLYFLWRLEKRVFRPIARLNLGVQEIARGNYAVSIESDVENEIGLLIASFNAMAQKLQAAETLKQTYEENRKTLIANISHDLKTPIAAIQGYIEAILDGAAASPEKVAKYLATIDRNIAYVNKLIDDLLLFSQLDLKKLGFHFEAVPIRAFMRDLMEEFQFELQERNGQLLYTDKLEQDYTVSIDSRRFNQAIRNVIGNAVKYGPENGLVVQTELYRQGNFVNLAIQDNGPGIPADKLRHIFERFYRIDSERTKDLMSTGLGLAIARELLEAHGGKIEAASTAGKGSCFTLSLPIQDQHMAAGV
jgi:signal transduction histidine kinase